MSRARFLHRAFITGAGSLSALTLGLAGPALAEVVGGTGGGTGGDYTDTLTLGTCGNGTNPMTAEVDGYSLVVNQLGNYTGIDSDNGNAILLYTGDAVMTVETTSTFWISPLGTHNPSEDPDCLAPAAIPITATVTGSNAGGSVNCSGSGTYTRIQSAVTIEFTGTCVIVDTDGTGGSGTAVSTNAVHTVEGELTRCVFPPYDEQNPNPACTADPSPLPPYPTDDPGSVWFGIYDADGT